MEPFATYVLQTLGVKVRKEYAEFMDAHGKKLPEDPVLKKSWIGGLGSRDFVVGTTLAFRARISNFRKNRLIIGYAGIKTIIVNKAYEEIDEYFMLDGSDGSVHTIDSLGIAEWLAASFEEWIGPELLRAELREKHASNLTVIIFNDELKAEEARRRLLDLQRQGFIELEDALVVVKGQDGKTKYHGMHRPVRKGGLAGSITGLIVGSIFFSPFLGAALGAVTGAVSAVLTEIKFDDQFMKDLSQKFTPGSSALFTLVRKADPERVREAFVGFGGKVLVNSVSREREALIQQFLDATGEGVQEESSKS